MIKVLLTVSETFHKIEEILNCIILVATKVPKSIVIEKIREDLQELNWHIAEDPQYQKNFKTLLECMKD